MIKSFKISGFMVFFVLCSIVFVHAQTKYPVAILPKSTKTFSPQKDTLWVLKHSQLKRAITDSKRLKFELEISKELKNKISLMKQQSFTKDSLVLDLTEDRDYYMNNWHDCKNDVKKLIAKNKRQRLFTRLSLGGIVVAFIAGFLIGR